MFISYSQNFEDIMLWRALRHIERGFYIDVGAAWPDEHSVTKAFYDREWHGINLEPNPVFFEQLCARRSRDVNLKIAVGDIDGTLTMNFLHDTGLSTLDDAIAAKHQADGWSCDRQEVLVRSLAYIWQEHVPIGQDVHFLKIDVEGFEKAALKGNNWEKNRPWIVVVEATQPLSPVESYENWEPILLGENYQLVYVDGLNRFYVAKERAELSASFKFPPNAFDNFKLAPQFNAEIRALQAESKVAAAEKKLVEVEAVIDNMEASTSWRVTAPLRELKTKCAFWALLAKQGIKSSLRKGVLKTTTIVENFPQVKAGGRWVIQRFPHVEARIRAILVANRRDRLFDADVIADLSEDNTQNLFTNQLVLPLTKGERFVYVFVDHTVKCSTNTGVQRVARGLCNGLKSIGEKVRFVKWHPESQNCLLISKEERENLAQWNGPAISLDEEDIYPPKNSPQIPVPDMVYGENHWLLIPEVTHITFYSEPVTLDVLMWAKKKGLKTGCIFYDAIPLRRPELKDVMPRHTEYMQHLLMADVVWPISDWAHADLKVFWQTAALADGKTMPEIETLDISGESSLCERVKEQIAGDNLILSVGSIEQRKNQSQLIRAFQAYCNEHSETPWRLILVGNVHPSMADTVNQATKTNGAIKYLGNVTDEELDALYHQCSFTVFPSVEEGYGLPIVESLWYGKPCLCANFGSMGEIAREGGCLTVDTHSLDAVKEGLLRLINDAELRATLSAEAIGRPIQTWEGYTRKISERMDWGVRFEAGLGKVYFWINGTLAFQKNTGIQRVTRQLARGLLASGVRLVPVKWGGDGKCLAPVSAEELAFFSEWNGPDVSAWESWSEPEESEPESWFFMPELPLDLSVAQRDELLNYVRVRNLKCAAIFYDAIPWKMRNIYPPQFATEHRKYMTWLSDQDLVLPISHFVAEDLTDFLGATLPRPQSLQDKIKAVPLPGEVTGCTRIMQKGAFSQNKEITILCVGTIEPRKNHETLLRAFALAAERIGTSFQLHLVLAGSSHSIEPALADRVRDFVANNPNIQWEEVVDDTRLRELHLACDFSIYPSIEEGFGLPILESLWFGKPCICANWGAMLEVGKEGGCLLVDVKNDEELGDAIVRMSSEAELRQCLVDEALTRKFKTWPEYSREIAYCLSGASPKKTDEHNRFVVGDLDERREAMGLTSARPKLSVCISTYNRAEWLAVSLKNWSRMYPEPLKDVEFVVCDNTSTDRTSEVVKPYAERSDFSYYRNTENVGMLGNLRQTAHHARGEYVWILGDDDLLLPGAIERVLYALNTYDDLTLVYLNYAYTREEDARNVKDFDAFFQASVPIVPAEPDKYGPIRSICARNENFFTAIYTLVLRRDHAIRAYSQDTSGRPFSTMKTCIPTTYYILNNMMELPGLWLGTPQLVVNLNVSWMKYAPLWILERIPEVYEEAEKRGVDPEDMDRWRRHSLPGIVHFFNEIYGNDPLENSVYFSPKRLVRRFKHLQEFAEVSRELKEAYKIAHAAGHPAARWAPSRVFPG